MASRLELAITSDDVRVLTVDRTKAALEELRFQDACQGRALRGSLEEFAVISHAVRFHLPASLAVPPLLSFRYLAGVTQDGVEAHGNPHIQERFITMARAKFLLRAFEGLEAEFQARARVFLLKPAMIFNFQVVAGWPPFLHDAALGRRVLERIVEFHALPLPCRMVEQDTFTDEGTTWIRRPVMATGGPMLGLRSVPWAGPMVLESSMPPIVEAPQLRAATELWTRPDAAEVPRPVFEKPVRDLVDPVPISELFYACVSLCDLLRALPHL